MVSFLQLHLHRGDSKKVLTSLIPCDNLPKEYGGNGPTIDFLTSAYSDLICLYFFLTYVSLIFQPNGKIVL